MFNSTNIIIAVVLLVSVAAGIKTWFYFHDKAIAEQATTIEKKAANGRTNKAIDGVKTFSEQARSSHSDCKAEGGAWDFAEGSCS